MQTEPAGRGCNEGTDPAGSLLRRDPCLHGMQDTGCKTPSERCLHLLMGLAPGLGHTTGKRDGSSAAEKEGSGPDTPRAWHTDSSAPHLWVHGGAEVRHRAGVSSPEPLLCRAVQAAGAAGRPAGSRSHGERAESAPGESPPARPFGRQRLGRSFSSITGPSE